MLQHSPAEVFRDPLRKLPGELEVGGGRGVDQDGGGGAGRRLRHKHYRALHSQVRVHLYCTGQSACAEAGIAQ